jgi:hypothetical protein
MPNRVTRGRALIGSLIVGPGATTIKNIWSGSVSLDPPSIATVARGLVTFTVTGAAVGDVAILNPPATLNDDLVFVGAAVTAADTVTVYIYNPTAGAIDDTAKTWIYEVHDIT